MLVLQLDDVKFEYVCVFLLLFRADFERWNEANARIHRIKRKLDESNAKNKNPRMGHLTFRLRLNDKKRERCVCCAAALL